MKDRGQRLNRGLFSVLVWRCPRFVVEEGDVVRVLADMNRQRGLNASLKLKNEDHTFVCDEKSRTTHLVKS